ncbi:hypothetical protein PYCCODRAFT_1214773 [Trametes coccinea BRFM310]|uniref:Uncharacterized protein n=1 Tax=Trametes coccinea (strain BRFM310) TaxID=1353009 RepID=A0A1Y2I6V4_TRAC3|nr:hypothetical protein PYCCODRAFT_1214773 [Trametes coccinea BRFM310]
MSHWCTANPSEALHSQLDCPTHRPATRTGDGQRVKYHRSPSPKRILLTHGQLVPARSSLHSSAYALSTRSRRVISTSHTPNRLLS